MRACSVMRSINAAGPLSGRDMNESCSIDSKYG